jgi:hypothetical protein
MGSWNERGLVLLLAVASFLGAALLFAVQPLVAKLLLPLLGGSAAVWNTAMVFFQLALVVGYLVAHVTTRGLSPRSHRLAQVGLLAVFLVTLPIALPQGWEPPAGSPTLWVFAALAIMVGGPFLALATVSPTLQRWLAETGHPRATNPYFLYAASNSGSLLALLAYPLLLEPTWGVTTHVRMWSVGYGFLVVLIAAAAWWTRGAAPTPSGPALFAPGGVAGRRRWFWVYTAAVPSALMLGVTRHLATDVASFPLLWVVPLAIYLATFIIAFAGRPGVIAAGAGAVRFLAIPLLLSIALTFESTVLSLLLPLAFFAGAGVLAHGRLYESRPQPAHLTEFYLWLAVGGAAGGVLASLIAPIVFQSIAEYPLAIGMALTVLPHRSAPRGRLVYAALGMGAIASMLAQLGGSFGLSNFLLGATGVIAFAMVRESRAFAMVLAALLAVAVVAPAETIVAERTFYGVYRIYAVGSDYVMSSGTTVHGAQRRFGDEPTQPIHYYHREGPVGSFFSALQPEALEVGVIGLGTGSMAAYAGPTDHYTFYEIDPAVVAMARDPGLFTFLEEAAGTVDVVVGDGRLEIAREPDGSFDVIVLDAFSSDAIPVHLLTTEAIDTYRRKLTAEGLLLVHISNRYLDLEPIVGRITTELGMSARVDRFEPTAEQRQSGAATSVWVVAGFGELPVSGWEDLRDNGPLWTDSYTSILSVFRWG